MLLENTIAAAERAAGLEVASSHYLATVQAGHHGNLF
jgi:hypothetical protein